MCQYFRDILTKTIRDKCMKLSMYTCLVILFDITLLLMDWIIFQIWRNLPTDVLCNLPLPIVSCTCYSIAAVRQEAWWYTNRWMVPGKKHDDTQTDEQCQSFSIGVNHSMLLTLIFSSHRKSLTVLGTGSEYFCLIIIRKMMHHTEMRQRMNVTVRMGLWPNNNVTVRMGFMTQCNSAGGGGRGERLQGMFLPESTFKADFFWF